MTRIYIYLYLCICTCDVCDKYTVHMEAGRAVRQPTDSVLTGRVVSYYKHRHVTVYIGTLV